MIYSQFAPLPIRPSNQLAPRKYRRVGIQRYQPNFWRLTRLTSILQFSMGKGLPLWRTGGDYWDARGRTMWMKTILFLIYINDLDNGIKNGY